MLDFANSGVLDPRITFTRASTATYFDASGTLQSAATDAPRFDYNPSTLAAQGLLIEEARTNSIRNNTMVGAVAGTPGTLPTNWSGGATISGLARTIVGVGTENGISYIDVNYAGTTTVALSNSSIISPEPSNQITAASGQTWTHSIYLKLQGGSFPASTTVNVRISETDGTSILANSNTPTVPTSAALNSQRYALTRTLTNALTTFVQPALSLTAPISTAIDFTLRIGLPQLEQGAFATSVIPTTTTALTRSADVASVNTLSPWYNAAEGTVYAECVLNAFATTQQAAWRIDDTTDNERMFVRRNGSTVQYVGIDGGVTQWSLNTGNTVTVGTPFKHAAAYKVNDIASAFNGGNILTATTATLPTVTLMRLGGENGGSYLNGYLRRITYYPVRLPNAQLQNLTK
jgi:hypothetical protein